MSTERDELKGWTKNDLIREIIELREKLSQVLKGGGPELTMESGARADGKPFITIKWGQEIGQLSPDEARLHALRMIETAEGAESDGVTVSFLRDQGMDENDIARWLLMQRDYRETLKERWRRGKV